MVEPVVEEEPPGRRPILFPTSVFEPSEPRRGHVTVAVIVLAIVATLTMSYLLRRPSGQGQGVTQAPADVAAIEQPA